MKTCISALTLLSTAIGSQTSEVKQQSVKEGSYVITELKAPVFSS